MNLKLFNNTYNACNFLPSLFILTWQFCSCTPDQEKSFIPTNHHLLHHKNFYKDYEYMHFIADYGPVNVGELFLEGSGVAEINDRPCYHVKARATLKGLAGEFSNLEDIWESYIDTSSLLPHKFYRDLKENKYRKKEITFFDRTNLFAKVIDTTKADQVKQKDIPITAGIEDMISSFYLFRNAAFTSLNTGDTIVIDVFLEETSYNAKIKYLGKEKIKHNGSKKECILVAPIIPDTRVLAGEYPIRAWLSNDAQRVPLKVQVKTMLGAVELSLKEYKINKKLH